MVAWYQRTKRVPKYVPNSAFLTRTEVISDYLKYLQITVFDLYRRNL